jgi:hypothetical protein
MLNHEIESRVHQVQKDVSKLQEVDEAIRPHPNRRPCAHENEDVARLISLVHGTEFKAKAERPAPADPLAQFQDALRQFTAIPAFRREQHPRRFLAAVHNHTRKTPAHVLARLAPCLQRLDQELDKVLRYDIGQPAFAHRAVRIVGGAERAVSAITREMQIIGGFEQIEPTVRESARALQRRAKGKESAERFETVADFKEKQLCALYRLRGRARAELVLARIREKMEEVVLPLLADKRNEADILGLRIASRVYTMLANDSRSYAVVAG